MNIVFFIHPGFTASQSMPRFAKMITQGMSERNHQVELWTSKPFFFKIPAPLFLKKWLGYIDQFVIFPIQVKIKLRKCPSRTLFVFADHALGPWVWMVKKRPFIIHCHDLLAQRSALGEIPGNRISFSGMIYQKWIRNGYSRGENFISISKRTQKDLHRFLKFPPRLSRIVYNGFNQKFSHGNPEEVQKTLTERLRIPLRNGYLLHVGGNQFYKNRKGVLFIYNAWREEKANSLPLLMVGARPTAELEKLKESKYPSDIYFLVNVSDEILKLAYQGATALLFPSLEEGFGWPIAEAMASGCPVITTNREPMTEVGGKSCFYLPSFPKDFGAIDEWSKTCAKVLNELVLLSSDAHQNLVSSGIENAKRFNTDIAIDEIESIYMEVLQNFKA